MDLRTRYTALVTLTTQHVKYISDALRRLEEEEVRQSIYGLNKSLCCQMQRVFEYCFAEKFNGKVSYLMSKNYVNRFFEV